MGPPPSGVAPGPRRSAGSKVGPRVRRRKRPMAMWRWLRLPWNWLAAPPSTRPRKTIIFSVLSDVGRIWVSEFVVGSERRSEPSGPANEVGAPRGYRLVRPLGEGAEGGAWEAVEASSGARVVLKAVPAEARRGAEHAFAVLRRSGSPALPAPRALVAGEGSSPTWLVTGFVEGEALERGPVSVAE